MPALALFATSRKSSICSEPAQPRVQTSRWSDDGSQHLLLVASVRPRLRARTGSATEPLRERFRRARARN
jgi:hypothetical protein